MCFAIIGHDLTKGDIVGEGEEKKKPSQPTRQICGFERVQVGIQFVGGTIPARCTV